MDDTIQNPCDTMMLRKIFRNVRGVQWKIFEKEINQVLLEQKILTPNTPKCLISIEDASLRQDHHF